MKRHCIIILLLLIIITQKSQVIYASSLGIGEIEDFKNLDGDGKYINNVDNYTLDIEKTDMFSTGEKMLNSIANSLFTILKVIADLVCSIFYFAMKFDINDILGDQIDGLQGAMKNSIFTPLFTLAFCGSAFVLIKRMIKQDMTGIFTEICKVVGIVILSIAVVNDSSTALTYTTEITKGISVDVLTDMNDNMGVTGGSGTSYAANAAGILWVNLIHEPWKSLEFGTSNPDEETIDSFLNSKSDKRKDLVKSYEKEHEGTFDKSKGAASIGLVLAYSIPFYVKCAVYLIVSMIQLVFQLLAVFFVLLAPLILILAMIPGYEEIIPIWLKKILETQVSILVLTFMMALMIKLDMSFYTLIPQLGWYVGIFFQIALSFGLFLGRNKILNAFSNMQRNMGNPRYMQMRMKHAGNPYRGMQNTKYALKRWGNRAKKEAAYENQINAAYKKQRDDRVRFITPVPEAKKDVPKRILSKQESSQMGESAREEKSSSVNITETKKHKMTEQPRDERGRFVKADSLSHPDYAATPTSYNQIDTSNLHEIWENAESKQQGTADTSGKEKNKLPSKKTQRPVTGQGNKLALKPAEVQKENKSVRTNVKRPVTYQEEHTFQEPVIQAESGNKKQLVINKQLRQTKQSNTEKLNPSSSQKRPVSVDNGVEASPTVNNSEKDIKQVSDKKTTDLVKETKGSRKNVRPNTNPKQKTAQTEVNKSQKAEMSDMNKAKTLQEPKNSLGQADTMKEKVAEGKEQSKSKPKQRPRSVAKAKDKKNAAEKQKKDSGLKKSKPVKHKIPISIDTSQIKD